MKREQLKKLLNEFGIELEGDKLGELIGQVLDMHHEELNKEKALTQAETDKLAALDNELKEANKTIKNLEKNRMDPEEVQNQIEEYKTTIAGLQQDLKDQEINAYVSTQLTLAGAYDVEVCQSNLKFDKERIKSKDDYGLIDDAIKTQIKEKSFLFKDKENKEEKKEQPDKPSNGYNPRVGNGRIEVNDSTGKDFAKLLSNEYQGFSLKGVNQK